MKTEKNILIAFILNLAFSIFEFVGGFFTGSVAIVSDAVHDLGDAASIGISYFLEKKSKRQPDEIYTYGYGRYSVIGGVITTVILLFGSVMVIYNALVRIINPTPINYRGMIVFALIGVVVNYVAAFLTGEGDSINQKAVNLHMLEDVLGWVVVLVGAVVMNFTDLVLIDPLMSIGVAVFILVNAIKNLKEALNLFLEKTPDGLEVKKIRHKVLEIAGVLDVHHVHLWSLDGQANYATMHIVTNSDPHKIKEKVREKLDDEGIVHATLELESPDEACHEEYCHVELAKSDHVHHHH
ncbi:MAG: cation diffusion facilitator family transporter [Finegoldia sp.]|nr:cation diffusion facilitator family transporter [Finegoldia sp.]